ncbi:MAG: multidrug efflux SMR transporter [Candidatus Methanomethylophilus sp.]|nr:multidrug efflux SMR transporter [Methanomethylophilus sp.]
MSTNWAWLAIFGGGCFETAWALTMKMSAGFTNLFWTAATLILLIGSMLMLNYGLKHGIPVGTGYSVWVGIGAVGSLTMGALIYGETLSFLQVLFAALIIGGVVGLRLTVSRPTADIRQERSD